MAKKSVTNTKVPLTMIDKALYVLFIVNLVGIPVVSGFSFLWLLGCGVVAIEIVRRKKERKRLELFLLKYQG